MIQLKQVSVSIDGKAILTDISYEFERNKVYAIMGPNGSGKSTLANVLMGHPSYKLDDQSKVLLESKDITELEPDKRSKEGIFLSFQSPLALSGVTVFELLKTALDIDLVKLKNDVLAYAEELKINPELLERSVNEGASGGERKKMELLQAAVLNPKVMIFDEIDTGVDVDALKVIAQFIDKRRKDRTIILITHYNRILEHVTPDNVVVLKDGTIAATDGPELAKKIEKEGYESINN